MQKLHLSYSSLVEGYCEGISKGYHTISLALEYCNWGVSSKDIHTGFNSCRERIIVEEYRPSTNIVGGTYVGYTSSFYLCTLA